MSIKEEINKNLPMQKRLRALKEAREDWIILTAFNEVVEELITTDAIIERLPEGALKEEKRAFQEEAWQIVLSEEMCDRIMIRE